MLPVLVQVDANGKITDVSPATHLSPQLDRLLHQNLAEMISKPATDKHGKGISSQFVINMALKAIPRAEGNYDVQFAYVSTSQVPRGSWAWVNVDGRRLALADRHSLRTTTEYHEPRIYGRSQTPQQMHNPHSQPTPPSNQN
ncbi:MAG: hypothetical protein ACTS5I_13225, partial [Rhodanobacter sp.]